MKLGSHWVAAVLVAVTGIRIWVAAQIGLGDAEAYYWTWSRDLDWSYYDHGPAVAALIRLGTELSGAAHSPLAVRLPFILLSSFTLWMLTLLAPRVAAVAASTAAAANHDAETTAAATSHQVRLWALLGLLAMPAFQVAGAAANPDVPLLAAVSLFLVILLRPRISLAWIGAAGLVAGLGVCSKLHALALVVPLLRMAWSLRGASRIRAVAAGLAGLGLGALPVVVWNLEHDMAGLLYHLVHRHGGEPPMPSLLNLGKLVGGQLAYVSPLLLVGLGWAAIQLARRRHRRRDGDPAAPAAADADPTRTLLLWSSAALLLPGYLLILVMPGAEPHWPMTGYLPLLLVLAARLPGLLGDPRRRRRRRSRALIAIALAYSALVAVGLHVHVLGDLGVRLLSGTGAYEPRYDLGNELRGWSRVADAVVVALEAETRRRRPHAGSPRRAVQIAACHYTSCSQLAFAARGRFTVTCPSPRLDQFDFRPAGDGAVRSAPPPALDLLYVEDPRFPFAAGELYRCSSVRRIKRVEVLRAGQVVRRFELQLCRDYAGLRAGSWPPRRGAAGAL